MRFMMAIKANRDTEAGVMPSEAALNAMAKYNEELVKAGVMLDGMGLMASAKGALGVRPPCKATRPMASSTLSRRSRVSWL